MWVAIASAGTVKAGEFLGIDVRGKQIALYNIEGSFYATDDECTHGFARLSEGSLDGEKIECPEHGGCFNAKSGKALEMPAMDPLRTYRVRVVGDDVEVYLKDDE